MLTVKDMADWITKVEIDGLWGQENLVWNLLPDVNILSGRNGSGKTTLIHALAQLVSDGAFSPVTGQLLQGMTVTFAGGDTLTSGEGRAAEGHCIDVIGPFDGRGGAFPIVPQKGRELFDELIDRAFAHTGKRIDRRSGELLFDSRWGTLTPQHLSSGEKQLLLIFATAAARMGRPAILLMDEPEISLHFDWQSTLIADIRRLNPNVQLILSTHSPAIAMNGWMGHVTEISELKVEC